MFSIGHRPTLGHIHFVYTVAHELKFVDFSVNYEPISLKFSTGIFKSYTDVGKKFAELYLILQKLDHLTCTKILELV